MIQGLFAVNVYKTRFDNIGSFTKIIGSTKSDQSHSSRSYQQHLLNQQTSSNIYSWRNSPGSEKLHDTEEFESIRSFIEYHAKLYWDALGYYPDVSPKIYQSWITHYHQGGCIYKHNHGRAQLAGVLYLQAEPGQGNIVFENPLELLLRTQPYREEIVYEQSFEQEVTVTTGDLILFPSYLKHYTQPNTTDRDRIIVSVNLNSTGEYHNPYVEKDKQL